MAYKTHLWAKINRGQLREERLNDDFTSIYGMKEITYFKETIV